MANIVCPGCSRIVDDSVRVCPGCKYNIKKYVKDLKKKGGITGSISLGSAYDETKASAPTFPELDFLKPKPAGAPGPAPELDFLKSAPAPAPAAAPVPELDFLKSAPAPAPAAPVPETQIYGTKPYQPDNSAPSYDTPAAAAAPVPETQIYGTTPYQPEVSAPSYDAAEAAPAAEPDVAVAETAPAHPAPEYVKNTLKYKPKVMATSAPEYDPDYKAKQLEAQAAAAAAPVPETQIYGTAPAAAPSPVPETQIYGTAPAAAPSPVPETQIYGTAPVQPSPVAAPAANGAFAAAPATPPVAPNVLADPPVGGFSASPSQTSNLSAHTASNINMPNGGLLQAASTGEQLFDSPLLNLTAVRSGAGALSGATGPSIMDKLREEEERKKMENDFVFESPNLRREESKIRTVGTANAGGALSNIGDMTFDYEDPDKKDIFRSTEKFKIGAGGDEQRKRQEEQRLLNEALNGGQYQPVRSSAYSAAPVAHTGVQVSVHAGSSISLLNANGTPVAQQPAQAPSPTQGVIPAPGQVVPAPETQIYGTAPAAAPQTFGNVPASGQVPGTGVYAPAQAGNGLYGQVPAPAQAGNGIYGQAPAPKSFEQTLQQPGNISHPKSAINFAPSYQSETGGFGTAAASPLYGGGQPEPQGPVSNGLSHGSNTGLSSANPFLGGGQ
jgi:hypothetical protein